MKGKEKSPFVDMASVLGGIFLVVVIMFLIFAKEFVTFLIPIVWAFAVLGMVLALFQYLSIKHKKK